jgi:hypothetical protein
MRRILLPLLFLLALAGPAAAQSPYWLAEWVIDEGGVAAGSTVGGNYVSRGSFHQTTIGLATAPGEDIVGWIGYWHPRSLVATHDVGVTRVIRPPFSMTPDTVTPVVMTRNFGRVPELFDVYIRIRKLGQPDTLYRSHRTDIGLSPDDSTAVSFSPVTLDTGTYEVIAWTHLDGDENPANDRVIATTIVSNLPHDVGVVAITSPPRHVQQYDVLPQAYVHNYGVNVESFWTRFWIYDSLGSELYSDSVYVAGLAAGGNRACVFAPVTLYDGWFDARCSTALDGDLNPANDTSYFKFLVGVWGWFTTTDIPVGRSNKAVNDGGSLTWVPPGWIYGLKGNRSTEFWRFDVATRTWQARESIPRPLWQYNSRPVKKGGALCSDGADLVYAVKGNNTVNFYAYSVGGDTWVPRDTVPWGPRRKRIRYGAGLAWQPKGDSGFVWLLKGSNTFDFVGYWVEGDTWILHAEAPRGLRNKRYKSGSCVTADDNGGVFALKSDYNEFYRFDVERDSWTTLASMPFDFGGYKRKVKDGAALTFAGGDTIYAFKGGNTWQFYRYDIARDTWYEELPIGLGPSLKRVKRGGALAWCPTQRRVYAFKGNRTWEFWYFIPPPFPVDAVQRPGRSGVAGRPTVGRLETRVVPSIIAGPIATVELELPVATTVTVTLLDVSGRLTVRVAGLPLGPGRHRLPLAVGDAPRGIYLVVTDVDGTQGGRFVHKLIIQR